MPKRQALNKTVQITVKLDGDLTEFLDTLSNRSAFIRNAVLQYCGFTCPLCRGKGFVPHAVGCRFTDAIDRPTPNSEADITPRSG